VTPEILAYLTQLRTDLLPSPGNVLEVGSFNVNGSPRSVFEAVATSYIGTDMSAGKGVDRVMNNADLLTAFECGSFDTVICCECLEHDVCFWQTVEYLRLLVKPGGYLIISTPALGFGYHAYPKNYAHFSKDAYVDWFFAGWDICDLRYLDERTNKKHTVAGIARKPA
jgi:SAM-dependent methyltransferase